MVAQDPHVELYYGGSWHDVTAADEVYVRDPIVIGHGHTAELSGTNPDQLTCTLKSVAGKYNPQNPASALYGQIGVNTPIRVRMGATDYRAHVEATEWKPGRVLAEGVDAWTELSAHGTLTRIGQGEPPLQSSPYRYILDTNPLSYWPMEDDQLTGSAPAIGLYALFGDPGYAGKVDPARGELRPHIPNGYLLSAPQPAGNGTVYGYMPPNSPTTSVCIDWIMKCGTQNNTAAQHYCVVAASPSDLSFSYVMEMRQDVGGAPELKILRGFSTTLLTVTGALADAMWNNEMNHMRMLLTQNGADIDIEIWLDGALAASVTDAARTLYSVAFFQYTAFQMPEGISIGHIAAYVDGAPDAYDTAVAAYGYLGETAGARFERLCLEEDIPSTLVGTAADTQQMGAQPYATIGDQFREVALTDNGLIHDTRDSLGLTMRTGRSLLNQTPALELDYAAGHISPPLGPTVDDNGIRNDITAKRRSGGEYRVVKTTGSRNVSRPADDPDGVGRYSHTHAINPRNDGMLANHATWQLAAGTVDAIRWNAITVDLVANPSLVATAAAVDIGDRITVDNPPIDFTPDMIDVIVIGTSEAIDTHRRSITYVCVPAAMYTAGEFTDGVSPDPGAPIRYNPRDSETNDSFISGTDTALEVIDNTGGALWSEIASGFDIRVAGVRLRVTAVSAPTGSVQTLTVDQAPINGIARTIPAGTRVELWAPARYAL